MGRVYWKTEQLFAGSPFPFRLRKWNTGKNGLGDLTTGSGPWKCKTKAECKVPHPGQFSGHPSGITFWQITVRVQWLLRTAPTRDGAYLTPSRRHVVCAGPIHRNCRGRGTVETAFSHSPAREKGNRHALRLTWLCR